MEKNIKEVNIEYSDIQKIEDELNKFNEANLSFKKKFFEKFFGDIKHNEIKEYMVILPKKFSMVIMGNDWIKFSDFCDNPVAFKRENIYQ